MKRSRILLQLFGVPFIALGGMDLALNEGAPVGSMLDITAVTINVLLISAPQCVWTLVYPFKASPTAIYLWGLWAAHAWLILFTCWLVYVSLSNPHDDGDSIVWLLYFPPCLVLIPLGAFIGHKMTPYEDKDAPQVVHPDKM